MMRDYCHDKCFVMPHLRKEVVVREEDSDGRRCVAAVAVVLSAFSPPGLFLSFLGRLSP